LSLVSCPDYASNQTARRTISYVIMFIFIAFGDDMVVFNTCVMAVDYRKKSLCFLLLLLSLSHSVCVSLTFRIDKTGENIVDCSRIYQQEERFDVLRVFLNAEHEIIEYMSCEYIRNMKHSRKKQSQVNGKDDDGGSISGER
jgi:hypothetical protein